MSNHFYFFFRGHGNESCSPDAYCNNSKTKQKQQQNKGSYNCTCKPVSLGVKKNVGVSVTFENIE